MSAENGYTPDRRHASAVTVGLATVALVLASQGESGAVRAQDVDPNTDSGHHLRLDAMPTYGIALQGDAQPQQLDDDATAAPNSTPVPESTVSSGQTDTPKRYYNYLPLAVQARDSNLPTATSLPPTEVPSATPSSTDLPPSPDPTDPPPSPTDLPPPSPTVTAVPPVFNPDAMHREPVLTSPQGDGVNMTTGGSDDVDWLNGQPQQDVLAGTGFALSNEPAGVELKVVAQPNLIPAIDGSKNLYLDGDPTLTLAGAFATLPDGQSQDLRTEVAYDANDGRWEVNGQELCDDETGDTAETLAARAATVTLLSRTSSTGEQHYVEVETPEGACIEVVDVNPNQPEAARSNHERHIGINLPPNTRGMRIDDIVRLASENPQQLVELYPELAYVRQYVEAFGGPEVAIADTDFWRSAEAWQLFSEQYLRGIAFNPGRAYSDNAPRLSQADLLVRIAQQNGLSLYMPSYVNSRAGFPEWVGRRQNDYGEPELDNPIKAFAREAYGVLAQRWGIDTFPALNIGAVANPASDVNSSSRRRRNYMDYFPLEAHWSSGPTSHVQDVMARVLRDTPADRLVGIEQHGLVLGDNQALRDNARRIVAEISATIPRSRTLLVLPIFNYPAAANGLPVDQLAAQIDADLGTYPVDYGAVMMPIYPNGDYNAGVALSAAAIAAREQNARLRVAIPGAWGARDTTDLLREPVFAGAMRGAVANANQN